MEHLHLLESQEAGAGSSTQPPQQYFWGHFPCPFVAAVSSWVKKRPGPMFEWDAGMGSSVCENCGSSKSAGCDCCPFVVTAAGFTKQGPGCPAPLFTFSVTDTAGRSFQVSRSASEFEVLHARLCEYGEVPDLPHTFLPPPSSLLRHLQSFSSPFLPRSYR